MISKKFSKVLDEKIIDFLNTGEVHGDDDDLLDSVESVSDLWVLANMKETYKDVVRIQT